VSTNYAKRPRAEIEAEIDRWVRFYPEIRGIFLDAQASGAEQVPFYQSLGQYVRNRIDRAVLVTNPGTLCAEGYFAEVPLDSAVVFENAQGFPDFHLPPWAGKYAAPEFSVVPYHVDTPEQMKAILQAAVLKGIGGIYVTDAMLPNPWDRLPAYFEDEVEAVRRLNLRMAP
jgi:hypothetical protein